MNGSWSSYLNTASVDWSESNVLETKLVTGQSNRNCSPTNGRVEVCNAKYGNTGWLGVAQIWITGGEHITQGATKMNDTYFSSSTYNTPEWKQMVVCQEIGHTFGLDHQDEDFNNANLGTCMDYTSNPSTNQHPNAHDYQELETIYSHNDNFTTVDTSEDGDTSGGGNGGGRGKGGHYGVPMPIDLNNPSQWGISVKNNGKVAIFERDFGWGNKMVTFVVWASN